MSGALVIAHSGDRGAAAVASALADRLGERAVRLLPPEAFALARWEHRVDHRGCASTRIGLADGSRIDDRTIGVVLDRIRWLPCPRFRRATARDRDYAEAEMQALVASWLASLGKRCVPSVRRHACVTPVVSGLQWAAAAAAAGLPVARWSLATSARYLDRGSPDPGQAPVSQAGPRPSPDAANEPAPETDCSATVLVAGDDAAGPLAARFGRACVHAARALGFGLLEFRFGRHGQGFQLVHVDPLPALTEPWAVAPASDLLATIGKAAAP